MSEAPETVASAAEVQPAALTHPRQSNPFTPGRLFGIAVLGAGCSLAAYYWYQRLDPERRQRLQGSALEQVRSQFRNWVDGDGGQSA